MPSSRYDVIPFVLNLVTNLQPSSILDVGIGFGKYGVLFREYLDIWKTHKPYNQRVVNLIGVEAYEDYRNPVWEVYDEVIVGDIRKLVKSLSILPTFGLLFLGDVIEHFSKEEGKEILSGLNYRNIIVVTPLKVYDQDAVYGNNFEVHKSQWTVEDFPEARVHIVGNQQVIYA